MRLDRRLGAGTVFEVWRAVDRDGRRFALKRPRPEWAARPEALAALRREAAVLAAARHPNVVELHALGTHERRLALATELLEGGDLVALAGADPAHWGEAFLAVLAALRHLHAAGWAHRDVKARNVLLGADGRARLIDFASAAPLGAAAPSGGVTPGHARPAGPGERVEPADDAYGAAALLFELARGPLPARPDEAFAAGRAAVLEALAPAVERLLGGAAEPGPGSLSELLNVIESVAPSRT